MVAHCFSNIVVINIYIISSGGLIGNGPSLRLSKVVVERLLSMHLDSLSRERDTFEIIAFAGKIGSGVYRSGIVSPYPSRE